MSRNESFKADDETSSTLRDLGYSEDEIGATNGQLPGSMAQEDRLRTSLRALSAETSRNVQERAQERAQVDQIQPKNEKIGSTSKDNGDYWQGRKDQAAESKQNRPPKSATPRAVRQVDPAQKAARQAKQAAKLARMLTGKKTRRRW